MSLIIRSNIKTCLRFFALNLSIAVLLVPLVAIPRAHATPSFTEYSVPTPSSTPTAITSGPDGAMWFTETSGEKIGRISSSGAVSEYPVLTSNASPGAITTGPDSAIWYGSDIGGHIGRVSLPDGNVTEFPAAFASAIVTGPDGALWFTNGDLDRITTSGIFSRHFLGGPIALGLTLGPDGNFWSTELVANEVLRITPSGSVTTYPLPGSSPYSTFGNYPTTDEFAPVGITVGPDGALWFTTFDRNSIGRITTDGQISEYTVPTANPGINRITSGPDGALWFTERNANQIGRITTSGTVSEFQVPTANSGPSDLAFDSNGRLWFTEASANKIGTLIPVSIPSAPTNLTIPSPTQNPALTWTASSGATSYNVYRNGTNIRSTTNTSYTDNTAPEGTDTYYVTAVNSSGESGPSNSVSVLVDRTAPTITYSVSPTPNSAGWNNSSPVTVTFACTDNTGGSGIASCSSPQSESADGTYTLTGTAVDNAGNSSSVNVTINLDQTAPTIGTPTWTNNPMATNQTTTVTVPVTDNLSGVVKGEYYLGTTDPGQGSGTPMTLSGGNLTSSFSNLTANVYTINFRAEDQAGNWSAPTTDDLVVYGSGTASGHGSVTPSSSDSLPTETGNNIRADFVFSLKYANPTDTTPTGMSTFMYGSQCHNPHSDCFTVTTDNTVMPAVGGLSWLVIPGNHTTASFQGTALLSQGTASLGNNYPIRVTVTGSTPTLPGHYELQIYQVGANPNTATPIYQVSEDLSGGNVTLT